MASAIPATTPQKSQTPKGKKERRANHRYPVKAPLRYRILGGTSASPWNAGRTSEMSAGGVLLHVREAIALETILELCIDWPGRYHDQPVIRLFVIGSVARIDSHGTVVRILSHQFRTVHGSLVQRQESHMSMSGSG
jgi:hypothetical protein